MIKNKKSRPTPKSKATSVLNHSKSLKTSKTLGIKRSSSKTSNQLSSTKTNANSPLDKYKKYINVKYVIVASCAFALFIFVYGAISKSVGFDPALLGTSTVNMSIDSRTSGGMANEDGSDITDSGSDFWLGGGQNAGDSYLGLRFTGEEELDSDNIKSAKVVFTTNQSQYIYMNFKVYGDKNSDSSKFSSSDKPSSRSATNASKEYEDNVNWKKGKNYSYDVTDIVKEVVDESGGKFITLIFKNNFGSSYHRKFIKSSNSTPKLVIVYEEDSDPEPTPTSTPVATPTPTSTPTATPTVTPTSTPTGTVTPSSTPTTTPVPSVTTSPTPTPTPTNGNVDSSKSFAPIDARMVGGLEQYRNSVTKVNIDGVTRDVVGCTPEVHDRFFTIGPDGRKYRTWHPLYTPLVENNPNGTWCAFGHEHGDPPLAIAKPSSGASLPPFGLAPIAEGRSNVEPHAGFKVYTHMSGQLTGWGTREQDGDSNGSNPLIRPDWDQEIVLHQGAPSFVDPACNVVPKPAGCPSDTTFSVTRITQRFHEFQYYTRDPQGRVVKIITMADTGDSSLKSVGGPGKAVVDRNSPSYEIWPFNARVGNVFRMFIPSAVTNPMSYFVGTKLAPFTFEGYFADSANTICGLQIFNNCSTKYELGHPNIPAYGFMGTMRSLDSVELAITNSTGNTSYCTDVYGNVQDSSLCTSNTTGFITQKVDNIGYNFTPNTNDTNIWIRNTNSAMWGRAFPEDVIPVGFPLGN